MKEKLSNIDTNVKGSDYSYKKAKELNLEYVGFGTFVDKTTRQTKAFSTRNGSRLLLVK